MRAAGIDLWVRMTPDLAGAILYAFGRCPMLADEEGEFRRAFDAAVEEAAARLGWETAVEGVCDSREK